MTPVRNVSWEKTNRVASVESPAGDAEIEWTVPTILYGETVAMDVRHYRDDVENLVEDPRLVTLDGAGNVVEDFDGRAILLAAEVRAGGTVRFRWRYEVFHGAPYQFRWQRVSGPTSPADVTSRYVGAGVYEADFTSLSASAYVFRLKAENEAATIVRTLLASVSVTPDNAGPPAVINLTAVPI